MEKFAIRKRFGRWCLGTPGGNRGYILIGERFEDMVWVMDQWIQGLKLGVEPSALFRSVNVVPLVVTPGTAAIEPIDLERDPMFANLGDCQSPAADKLRRMK